MVFVYARPDSDTSTGSWKNNLGGAALFSSIDETAVDDSDYIVSAPNTFNDACKISLSDVGIAGDPSTVRYRYRKYEGAASTQIDLHVKLLQGTTIIAAWDHSNIGTSFTTVDQALTTPQFQSITDFRDLYLTFTTGAWWLDNSAIDLDFQNGRTWDGAAVGTDFTTFLSCTRASTGYARTVAGTLTSFGTNTLRITDSGLLVEDARTNLLVNSDISGGTSWTVIFLTVGSGITGPDGVSSSAFDLKETIDNNIHVALQQLSKATSALPYTFSVIVSKAGGLQYIKLRLDSASSGEAHANYDLVNGTVSLSPLVSGGFTGASATIEQLTSSFYRCTLTCTSDATAAIRPLIFALQTNTSAIEELFVGNTSDGFNVFNAQLEQASFASSPIPTTTVAATRAADNVTTISTLQTVINAATASLVAQTDNGGAAGIAANIVDSNGTNLLGFNSSNNAVASITATLATGNAANRKTQDKIGLAWNPSGRSLVLNGGTVATDASAQTPSATQHIGSSGATNVAYAYVERLSAWTTKLADATLQVFTV